MFGLKRGKGSVKNGCGETGAGEGKEVKIDGEDEGGETGGVERGENSETNDVVQEDVGTGNNGGVVRREGCDVCEEDIEVLKEDIRRYNASAQRVEEAERLKRRVVGWYNREIEGEVDRYLKGDETFFPESFSRIDLGKEAFEKGLKAARRVCEIAERPVELYLNTEGRKGVIEDVCIATHQEVDHGFCRIMRGRNGKEYVRENGLDDVGWMHSHCDFSTHHSDTDDRNTLRRLFREGRKDVHQPFGDGTRFTTHYFSSVVINTIGGAPFGAVGMGYFVYDPDTYRPCFRSVIRKNVPVRLVNSGSVSDFSDLDGEIVDRVEYESKKVRFDQGMVSLPAKQLEEVCLVLDRCMRQYADFSSELKEYQRRNDSRMLEIKQIQQRLVTTKELLDQYDV
tara:strand:- start:305 stop:1492 length:1188 start_codon:yes stop_codon:yes gene_type:complete